MLVIIDKISTVPHNNVLLSYLKWKIHDLGYSFMVLPNLRARRNDTQNKLSNHSLLEKQCCQLKYNYRKASLEFVEGNL